MYQKSFVCLCTLTVNTIADIFNAKHSVIKRITYINYKTFEDYLQELELAQTDKQTESISTFQHCWNGLKS